MKKIELTYCGGLKLDKVSLVVSKIESVQQPENTTKVGCIVQMESGEKFPVKETYEYVNKIVS